VFFSCPVLPFLASQAAEPSGVLNLIQDIPQHLILAVIAGLTRSPPVPRCHCGFDPQSPLYHVVIAGLTRNPLYYAVIAGLTRNPLK